MQGISCKHAPGAVVLVTGDLTRYALAMQSIMGLVLPDGSCAPWMSGVLIQRSLNDGIRVLYQKPELQWIWIMGDDHVFEPDIVLRLLEHEKDVIQPFCLGRLPPMDPIVATHTHKRTKYLEEMPTSGLYKRAADETCGDAGLLIRRKVIEAIPDPWYDHRISGSFPADDQAFTGRIKNAGFDIFVDMDTRMGHIGNVVFLPTKTADGKWAMQLTGGGARHICNLAPQQLADNAFQYPVGDDTHETSSAA